MEFPAPSKIRYLFLPFIFLIFLAILSEWLFLHQQQKASATKLKQSQVKTDYDLIVVGSDPEGIAAAVSGSRNGLRTLLVDTRPVLGGLITRGWLNTIDMNYGPEKEILNKGIFQEFYDMVEGDSFDLVTALNAFNTLVNHEANLDLLLNATEIKPVVNKSEISGVRVILPEGKTVEIKARRFIDATQDADLAAQAGVPFTVGLSDCGRPNDFVAVTLIFQLKGVNQIDWLKLRLSLEKLKEPYSGASFRSAWGFLKTMKGYHPLDERVAVRGLNIGRQKEGRVLVNTVQVFGIDPLSQEDRVMARFLAEREIPRVVEYIKKHIPGMSSVTLDGVAPELYIRDSRHIQGLYRLTIDDVLENRDFWDRIAFGSYPVDIQGTSPGFRGDIIGDPEKYAIPFRCLVPRNVYNLLVVGRAASFDALAAGSARVIPVGMATGQAAGAAAALSIEQGISFKQMSESPRVIEELQERLNNQGMNIKPFSLSIPSGNHWAYPGLKFVRRWGMASGGYKNDYRLDEKMTEQSFINCLDRMTRLTKANVSPGVIVYSQERGLTAEVAAQIMCYYLGLKLSPDQAYNYLDEKGFWDSVVKEHLQKNSFVTRGAGYMMIKNFIKRVGTHQE